MLGLQIFDMGDPALFAVIDHSASSLLVVAYGLIIILAIGARVFKFCDPVFSGAGNSDTTTCAGLWLVELAHLFAGSFVAVDLQRMTVNGFSVIVDAPNPPCAFARAVLLHVGRFCDLANGGATRDLRQALGTVAALVNLQRHMRQYSRRCVQNL